MEFKKKKKVDFPMTPDGRLIIREDKEENPPLKNEIDSGMLLTHCIIMGAKRSFLIIIWLMGRRRKYS